MRRWPTVTMPARYSDRIPATSGGVSRMARSSRRTTSDTASTRRPVGPAPSRRTMIRVRTVAAWGSRLKRRRLSRTGTMRPRRLITPSTNRGLPGTGVISTWWVISCTRSMSMPNSTPSSVKVTSWPEGTSSVASCAWAAATAMGHPLCWDLNAWITASAWALFSSGVVPVWAMVWLMEARGASLLVPVPRRSTM